MKKFVSVLLSVIIILGIMPFSVGATETVYNGTCGDDLSWTLDDEGILTISGEGDMGDFSSDSMPWDSNVPWYNFESSIKEVVIGENVTSISHYAFYECRNIEKIYWNAKNIKDFSSDNCIFYNAGHDRDGIELIFSDNVENIPAYLSNPSISYDLSPKIKSIKLGNNIVTIGRSAFYGCMDIVEITIPETVEQIQDGAFWYCNSLSDVYYNGSKAEWGNISIGSKNNTCLTNANIHYSESNNVINVSNINDLQSEHPYSNNEDTTWVYTYPSKADTIQVTFSDDTETESGYDFIYIYDGLDNLVGEYSGTELARKTISVDGNIIKIKLTSDYSETRNGFTVSSISVNAYVLTYDANGGSGEPNAQIKNKGEDITLSTVIPIRKGYVFNGWATDSDAIEAEYLSGSIINIDANITLYAVWKVDEDYGIIRTSNINDLQSEHPYSNNEDTTWIYTHPSEAETLQVTFSDDTETESGYDFIYIYDGFDNLVGEYSGTELAYKTIEVEGNMFKIKLTSDESVTKNGFTVSELNAVLSTGPITNLKYIARTNDTVTLLFPKPIGATNVIAELSKDGESWEVASTLETIDALSTTATLTGLRDNTQYYFRLDVVGGEREGLSNEISARTAEINNFISQISEADTDAVIIRTAEELSNITEGSYVLGNDIYLENYNDGVWNPIFPTGDIVLDGQGHKIYNLNILTDYNSGLFSESSNKIELKNLGLDYTVIDTAVCGNHAGGMIGIALGDVKIENCFTNIKVKAFGDNSSSG